MSPGQTLVFTWDELKLINEILYDNVYLASFGIIFITGHPLVGSLRGRGFWARGKHEGRARREGVRETPARKSLFSTSRLLIMYTKITQAVND